MTNYIARGRQVVVPLTNKSAGSVAAGDTVILSSGTAAAFTTTTSAGQTDDFVGVVYDATIAQDATGLVILQGFVPLITLSSSASLGDYVKTHSVAKQSAPTGTRGTGTFGQVLGTGTTPAAFIWGFPDPATAAGNVATDAIWDVAGDIVQGTGANTAARLAIGTAYQMLRVNSGATALEYAGGLNRIGQAVAGVGGASYLEVGSIPAGFASLKVHCYGRSDFNGTANLINLTINGDTGNNYDREVLLCYATTAVPAESLAQASLEVANFAALTATADVADQVVFEISGYANTTFQKSLTAQSTAKLSTSTTGVRATITSGWWRSTAAITTLRLTPASSAKFVQGSTMTVWGVY